MNQQDRPIGVPGGRPAPAPNHQDIARNHPAPALNHPAAAVHEADGPAHQTADTDRLLQGVEVDLARLDGTNPQEQVQAFDRMHAVLADALARTADTGGPPPAGGSSA